MNKMYLLIGVLALSACQKTSEEPIDSPAEAPVTVKPAPATAPTSTPPPSVATTQSPEAQKPLAVTLDLPQAPSFNLAENAKGEDLTKLTYDQYKEKEQQMKQRIVEYSKAAHQERSKHQEEIAQLWKNSKEVSSSVLNISYATHPFVFLPPNSNPEGSIEVEMLISQSGQVLDAKVKSSTFSDQSINNAIVAAVLLERYKGLTENVRSVKTISIAPKD